MENKTPDEKSGADKIPTGWYLVKIVFQVTTGESPVTQFDAQHRMVTASSHAHAIEKAKQIGQHEEGTFQNEQLENVNWKFIAICDINVIGFAADGEQLFSETHETKDPFSYIYIAQQRAKMCEQRYCFPVQNLSH